MFGNLRKIFQNSKQNRLDSFDRLNAPENVDSFEPSPVEVQEEIMQVTEIAEDIQKFEEIEETEDFSDLFEVLDKTERPTSKLIVKTESKPESNVVNLDQFRKAAPKSEKAVEDKSESAGDMCALPDNLVSNDWSKGRALVDWTRAQ